jgi:ADP-ribose pyrophosphatase YjhB (NUDIX family)
LSDILFKTEDYIFSYRVAGICMQNGKLLLQKPTNDSGYAFPGGHVAFGETNSDTLIREFKEEIRADISVGELKWVAEIFFPWGDKPCHQICLYYDVKLNNEKQIPLDGMFIGDENLEERDFKIEFHWIPLDMINEIEVYPTNTAKLIQKLDDGVQHFVYREE